MTEFSPQFQTFNFVTIEPIEEFRTDEKTTRLTLLVEEQGGQQFTLTIETQQAHDIGVLEGRDEVLENGTEQEELEPVLILPDHMVDVELVQSVLTWPRTVLEHYLVPQVREED